MLAASEERNLRERCLILYLICCATSRKVAGSIPDQVIGFFNWPNSSSRIVALGSTQPLTEMSTRKLPAREVWPMRKADDLTAICELIV
jgi:hypothetical protein